MNSRFAQLSTAGMAISLIASMVGASHAGVIQISPRGPDGIDVLRDQWTLINKTGKDVNDLEFTLGQKERWIKLQGGTVTSDRGTLQEQGRTDHTVSMRLDDFNLANGESLQLLSQLDLSDSNKRWISYTWTINGTPEGKRRSQRHAVGIPKPGGSGGLPIHGGGGKGGQDGGGGSGSYIHWFTIYNDNDTVVELSNLSLLASMVNYPAISDVPWAGVVPIDLGATSVQIAPFSGWTYAFETTGSYLDGSIYYAYDYLIDGSDLIAVSGQHPVYVPVPEPTVLHLSVVAFLFAMATRRLYVTATCRTQSA